MAQVKYPYSERETARSKPRLQKPMMWQNVGIKEQALKSSNQQSQAPQHLSLDLWQNHWQGITASYVKKMMTSVSSPYELKTWGRHLDELWKFPKIQYWWQDQAMHSHQVMPSNRCKIPQTMLDSTCVPCLEGRCQQLTFSLKVGFCIRDKLYNISLSASCFSSNVVVFP